MATTRYEIHFKATLRYRLQDIDAQLASGCYSPFPHPNTRKQTNNNYSAYMQLAAIEAKCFAKSKEERSYF